MVELAQQFSDSQKHLNSASFEGAEAHGAAQKMLACVQLHNQSSSRDLIDKSINVDAITSDRQGIDNAYATKAVNAQILEAIAAHKPVSAELKTEAIALHLESRELNNADSLGDVAAQAKDVRDIKAEQAVINSDRKILRDGHLSFDVREKLQEDIASKVQLQQSERRDLLIEKSYINFDDTDSKLNKAVIDGLNWNSPQLGSLLLADNASKEQIIGIRNYDMRLEPAYSAADVRDQILNEKLSESLKNDPYFAAARRQDAGLPVWTSEEKLKEAELLQHERRRLHLAANSTPEQVKLAQEADMNKQLDLPPWDTKEQRIAARKVKHARHAALENSISSSYERGYERDLSDLR